MTESIGVRLDSLIGTILPINLSEAETNAFPYATYEQTPAYTADKDGKVLRIRSEVTIHIYDRVFSTAEDKATQVMSTIASAMHDGTFGASLRTVNKECTDGIWDFELNYTILQFKDYVPPVTPTEIEDNQNTE